MPQLQVPFSRSDQWSLLPGTQSRSTIRSGSSIQPLENPGYVATTLPEDRVEPQTPGAFSRPQRRPTNRDEFDGAHQLLNFPSAATIAAKDQPLPNLPVSFNKEEQDDMFGRLHELLSECAFDFVARYQFPIPIEQGKPLVLTPQDREWKDWVYLLKRLATKRRIPARVLYDDRIKNLVTVLENSLEAPYTATHQPRPLMDDRSLLQFISAGTQVAKILKDAAAMRHLDRLYSQTASYITERRWTGLPI